MATTATLTGAQFDALPYEEGRLWELVDGELIPMPSPTGEHQFIVQELLYSLMGHIKSHPEQGLVTFDIEFALGENYRLRPDLLVLVGERAKHFDRRKIPAPGSPDIAVEVISPSERPADSRRKVEAYLRHGTREVWQVYPMLKTVVIHRGEDVSTLACGQRITTELLPGFSLAVESIFEF